MDWLGLLTPSAREVEMYVLPIAIGLIALYGIFKYLYNK
jgi:hypothetical protein